MANFQHARLLIGPRTGVGGNVGLFCAAKEGRARPQAPKFRKMLEPEAGLADRLKAEAQRSPVTAMEET
jgi:hypothetical protein